jgi:hypothetical protein
MNIPLIQGQFNAKDATDLITQLIHVKIKFHEGKINHASSEEDIKMREQRIKQLQKDLYEARLFLEGESIGLEATIRLSRPNNSHT